MKNRGNANPNGLTQLEKARLTKGLSIAEICRLTGLNYDNYIKYERGEIGEQHTNFDTLHKLSDILGINLFSEYPHLSEYHHFKQNSMQIVRNFMEDHNLSIRRFATICGVSVTSVKQWRNGTCSPSFKIWEKIFKN